MGLYPLDYMLPRARPECIHKPPLGALGHSGSIQSRPIKLISYAFQANSKGYTPKYNKSAETGSEDASTSDAKANAVGAAEAANGT